MSAAQQDNYTTQLAAGLGMIPETIELLRLWRPGLSPAKLSEPVIGQGIFSRATARRARNLVAEMFAPRYLAHGGDVASQLKFLVEHQFPQEPLSQLFFLQTARAQKIFADFVVQVYWPKYSAGAVSLSRDDATTFVRRALDSGKMVVRWSDSTVKRVSGYLIGCCADYGLIGAQGRAGARPIKRFSMRAEASLFLVHELHFAGIGDQAIVGHPDWKLFGYEPADVLNRLKTLANDGHFLVQSSGELVQISWKHRNMEDFLNALAQR